MKNYVSPAISLPILSEAVTIVITPASRFGEAYDVARFINDIHLAQPLATPQKFLLPKSETLSASGPVMTLPNGREISFDPIDAGALEQLRQKLLTEVQDFMTTVTPENAQEAKDLIDEVLSLELLASKEEIPAGTQFIKFHYTRKIETQPDGSYVLNSIVPLASFTAQPGSTLHMLVVAPYDPATSNIQGEWTNPRGEKGNLQVIDAINRKTLAAYWNADPELTIRYSY